MKTCILAVMMTCAGTAFAYTNVSGGTVSAGNRLDYSLSSESSEEILEDYFDVDYLNGPFMARFRFEVFQPSEESRDRQGMVYRAVGGKAKGFELWVGHYYSLFGRGLAFRGYEDRELRVDTSLDGLHLTFDHRYGTLKGFSGRTAEESQVLHGIDGEVRPLSALVLGGSYVSRRRVSSTGYRKPGVELGSGRAQLTMGPVDFYGEYGERSGDGESPGGRGAYVAATGYVLDLGFSFEFKDYRDMSLKAEGKEYTNPPAALSEHSWALLAKHAHEMNVDDERGFLGQVEYMIGENIGCNAAYASAEDHDDVIVFEEATAELRLWDFSATPVHLIGGWTEEFKGTASSWQDIYDDRRNHVTVMGEGSFPIDETWSLKVLAGHQHTDGDAVGEYDLEHVELELTKSPALSVAVVGEWSNVSDNQRALPWLSVFSERTAWFYGQLFLNLTQEHQLRVMVGSRPEGKVCAGGACRIEPEFEGIELALISIF